MLRTFESCQSAGDFRKTVSESTLLTRSLRWGFIVL